MRIAKNLEMLKIPMTLSGGPGVINATLLLDRDAAILVDAGMAGYLDQFEEAVMLAGTALNRISTVIITHQDWDHIGGLPELREAVAHPVEVISHRVEQPYIQGDRPSAKLTPERLAQIDALPEEERRAILAMYQNTPRSKIDRTVEGGETLSYAGGLVVIHTPGHTPGHLCLYHQESKTLIAGDAMNVVEGKLLGPNPQYTVDLALATASLKKLAPFDIETVICYHGGLYRGKANERIAELAKGIGQ